jgi:hypothetical protein
VLKVLSDTPVKSEKSELLSRLNESDPDFSDFEEMTDRELTTCTAYSHLHKTNT